MIEKRTKSHFKSSTLRSAPRLFEFVYVLESTITRNQVSSESLYWTLAGLEWFYLSVNESTSPCRVTPNERMNEWNHWLISSERRQAFWNEAWCWWWDFERSWKFISIKLIGFWSPNFGMDGKLEQSVSKAGRQQGLFSVMCLFSNTNALQAPNQREGERRGKVFAIKNFLLNKINKGALV